MVACILAITAGAHQLLSSPEPGPLPEISVEQTESASAAPTPKASSQAPSLPEPTSVMTPSASPEASAPVRALPSGEPVRVTITRGNKTILDRKISGSVKLKPVGNQLWLVPPSGVVTWVNDERLANAKPGFPGSAMLAAHISQSGEPGPFYGLTQTLKGDSVTVTYGSGDRVKGTLTNITHPDKLDLPVEKIRGAGNRPVLWLVTCDPSTPFVSGHYLGNVLVYVNNLTVSR